MSSFPRKREPSAFARTGPESGKSLGSRFRGNDDQGRSSKSRTRVPNPSPKSPAPSPQPHKTEETRVGKGSDRTCISWGSPDHQKKKNRYKTKTLQTIIQLTAVK